MAARRHKENPARVKQRAQAVIATPPPEIFERRIVLRRRISVVLLCLLTVVLLSVSFAPFNWWPLAYVALVPWILALAGGTQRRWPALWGWLTGLIFWAANLYWLWWVTLIGYAATVVYLSAYWFVAAVLIRAAARRNWPMWIVFPVVWVALEYARAHVISGFPWFCLSASQWQQVRLIQIADVTGRYGVSFFVAMVNGALADLLIAPLFVRRKVGAVLTRQIAAGLVACLAVAGGLLGYGTWRVNQNTLSAGPVVGLAQCSFRSTLAGRDAPPHVILQTYLETLERLDGVGCDVALLPESTIPSAVNLASPRPDPDTLSDDRLRATAELLGLADAYEIGDVELLRAFVRQRTLEVRPQHGPRRTLAPDATLAECAAAVSRTADEIGCPVIAGGMTAHYNDLPLYVGDEWHFRNSVLCFDPPPHDGDRQYALRERTYAKMHPVPFSEYVPFRESWPAFHRVLRWLVPPVMRQVAPGESPTVFLVRGRDGQDWHLAPIVCYEGLFARVCRRAVNHARHTGRKDRTVLVNLSNDGWFVWTDSDGVNHPSTEHAQHMAVYAFRAIENRVPVVRAVNTGISAAFDPNGRMTARVAPLETRALSLSGQEPSGDISEPIRGPKLLVDQRVSVYSRVGDGFAWVVCLASAGLTGWVLTGRMRHRKQKEPQ
ncbi:MAG: hypothetical protein KGY99_03875 [Phycisphaerae bacterium]|nr:hypothetical protein [Phycisphaerae bacterium]